jgi:hypothetical protein
VENCNLSKESIVFTFLERGAKAPRFLFCMVFGFFGILYMHFSFALPRFAIGRVEYSRGAAGNLLSGTINAHSGVYGLPF